ncbi:MAG: ATP-binding protein [Pseudomonadota bacterium]
MASSKTTDKKIDSRPDLSGDADFATKLKAFRAIRIEHPRLLGIHKTINELRLESRTSRGEEQNVLPIIGPTQSGKSLAIKHYVETVVANENHPKGKIPLLSVRISPGSSLKQLQADILSPLVVDEEGKVDETELKYGTEASFRAKVRRYTEKRGTDAIAIDEAQHLITRNAGKTAKAVADSIKLMAIEGAAAFIVAGVNETWKIFQANNKQLPVRCFPPIFLNPLDFEKEDDAELFAGYVAMLDLKLVEHGITSELSGFTEGDMVAAFWEVSGGVVGIVSRLVRVAWGYAVANGLSTIPRSYLAVATDRWAIALGLVRRNPFRDGARPARLVKKDWAAGVPPEASEADDD